MLARVLLADGSGFDAETWGLIGVAIVSAVASLFQKYKKRQQEREKAAGMPSQPPATPTPARPPQLPPRPVRRVEAPRPASQRRVIVPDELREMLRQVREAQTPRPAAPLAAAVVATPAPVARLVQPAPIARAPLPARAPAVSPLRSQIDALVRNQGGLRAAFALSEILGKPVSLRDDHLERF